MKFKCNYGCKGTKKIAHMQIFSKKKEKSAEKTLFSMYEGTMYEVRFMYDLVKYD